MDTVVSSSAATRTATGRPANDPGAMRAATTRPVMMRARLQRSVSPRSLARALVAAVFSFGAVSASQAAMDIWTETWDPDPYPLPGLIAFDQFANKVVNRIYVVDGILEVPDPTRPNTVAARFAERFVGQGLDENSTTWTQEYGDGYVLAKYDRLTGTPTMGPSLTLTLQPGKNNQNLAVVPEKDNYTNKTFYALAGASSLGADYWIPYALGEGALAVLFPEDQTLLNVWFDGSGDGGYFVTDFFRRDGSLIETFKVSPGQIDVGGDTSDKTIYLPCEGYCNRYGFYDPAGEIAGFSLYNHEDAGFGITQISPYSPDNHRFCCTNL